MKFKEKFKEVYTNGQKWAEKHKWLCRILCVVLACFILLAIFGVRSCSEKRITASADSVSVVVPDDSYIITTLYNPQLYVSWANSTNVSTLINPPVLYISSSGYYCSFGKYFSEIPSDNTRGWATSDFYRVVDSSNSGVNPSVPDSFGFYSLLSSVRYSSSEFYNKLITGDLVISRVEFHNYVGWISMSSENYFSYLIYVVENNSEHLGVVFQFIRDENVNVNHINVAYDSSVPGFPFSYVVSFNGLSTSSLEYQAGYLAGNSVGQSEGYQNGYSVGNSVGYESGYNAGISETLSDITPWQTIVDGVSSFLNIELLPNVKLSVLLSVALGGILFIVVLRIIRH